MLRDKIKQLREEYKKGEGVLLKEVISLQWTLANTLRNVTSVNDATIYSAAFLLAHFKKTFKSDRECTYKEILETINKEIAEIIKEYIDSNTWNILQNEFQEVHENYFSLIPFLPSDYNKMLGEYKTPESLINLSEKIFDLKDGMSVADLCCGKGDFLLQMYLYNECCKYYGIDINVEVANCSKIRSNLLGEAFEIEIGDLLTDTSNHEAFDCVFTNFPFGLQVLEIGKKRTEFYREIIEQQIDEKFRPNKLDWHFVFNAMDKTKKDGKTICVVPISLLWKNDISELSVKKYFLRKNYIESIVLLPENMFDYTGIITAMLVLNKNKKTKNITMIDASKTCKKGRRLNYFDEDDIQTISDAFNQKTNISSIVTETDIVKMDYNLYPSKYVGEKIVYENGVLFERVVKSITRGAPLKANELDAISTKENTGMHYLMLQNINDGIISSSLPNITKIDKKNEKYCINNNNLLISKTGAPYKIAVASINDGEKILANGNLYVIDVDENIVNPYYLKAFLISDEGEQFLKSISTPGAIPSIGVKELMKSSIPLPPVEEQNRIAKDLQIKENEIRLLEKKIKIIKDDLKQTWSSER